MSKAAFDAVKYGALAYGAYNQYRGRNSTRAVGMGRNEGGGNMTSRSYVRIGRKKRRTARMLWKSIQYSGDRIINRWQQTSRTYVGPGRVFLGLSQIDATLDRLPIHFISLTNSTVGNTVVAKGAVGNSSMTRMYYNKINGSFFYASDIPSQVNTGEDAITVAWQRELRETATNIGLVKNIFHNWTDVRINLYGCYTVPIHYKILVCTMPEQLDPLQFGQGNAIDEGSECANMFKDWARKLSYDSVGTNGGHTTWRKDIRVVKELNYTIQPLSYSDQAAEAGLAGGSSTAAHIKEVKFFLRHDRFRNYQWSRLQDYVNEARDLNAPGWDDQFQNPPLVDVEWGKRVFMFITASVTERLAADPIFMTDPAWAQKNGSYDCCIRNCFTIHY